MSERLYYTNAYITEFDAQVIDVFPLAGEPKNRIAVVLDQTYFYPNSGGQPADQGFLNDVPVVDVTIRPEDGAVLHHLDAGEFTAEQVSGRIDWERRFDHMQHHTGQHILSRAFIKVAKAETVSFHLGREATTIDVGRTDLSAAEMTAVEQLANRVIWENRPVYISFASQEVLAELPLRKRPPVKDGQPVRLVDIDGFDLTACGGTHVAHTGAIGLIKIVKQERRGDKTRVEFLCGHRAVSDYDEKNDTVHTLMGELTTAQNELLPSIQKLKEERREAYRTVKQLQEALQAYEAAALLAEAQQLGDSRVVAQVFVDKTAAELKTLASQLTDNPAVVALLALAGEKCMLLFKRSDDAAGEMQVLLKQTLQQLGSRAGGGTAEQAQGGGFTADVTTLEHALQDVCQQLATQIAP